MVYERRIINRWENILAMHNFKDKLAVITGGASGVGRSIAFALGAEGGRVLIADVDIDLLRELHQLGSVRNLKDRRKDLFELKKR